MKTVFPLIFVAAGLAIFTVHQTSINFIWLQFLIIPFFACGLIFFYFKKHKTSYVFLSLSIALIVMFCFQKEKDSYHQIANQAIPRHDYIDISGKLLQFPHSTTDKTIINLESQSLIVAGKEQPFKAGFRITVAGKIPDLNKHDHILISCRVSQPISNVNFFKNPMADYYLAMKCHFSGYCKSARLIEKIGNGSPWWRMIGSLRKNLRHSIEAHFFDNKDSLSIPGQFFKALLLGDRSDISNENKELLIHTGVFHVLAISGAHIAVIAWLCFFIMQRLRFNRWWITTCTLVILMLFLHLSGNMISAQRAVLVSMLIMTGHLFFLDISFYNILSACGLFLLFYNPLDILNPGFVLTFVLSAAIVKGRAVFLPLLSKISFLPVFLREFLSATIAAYIISLPLSLYFFKRFAISGFFNSLLLIPLTAILFIVSIVIACLLLLVPAAGIQLFILIDYGFQGLYWLLKFCADHLSYSIYRAAPPLLVILFFIGCFFLIQPILKKRNLIFPAVCILLLIFFVIPDQIYQPHELELYFLDVGQGDSIIAVFPGGDALLVDGGGAYYGDFETGRQIVLPFVLEKRIKIRWMAVSHFHPDHVNGIVEILPILKPKEIWLATILNTQPIYKALCSRAGKNTLIRHINCGYKMQINSCHVECLYPFTVLNKEKAENNDSMVLKISNATHSFLLTGDIEKQTEFKLLKHHPDKLSADVLKIPHHGSKTSSSINFLQTIAPRLAIISCGAENHFGFPHRQVLDNLKKTKTPCLTTAFQGGISVTSAKTKLIISVSK